MLSRIRLRVFWSLCAALLFGLVQPTAMAQAAHKELVGISMPTRSSARWFSDGGNIEQTLKAQGFRTELTYADDQATQQTSQIEQMIANGARVLIIAAIDGSKLKSALEKAGEKGIKVIAYDRLIKDSKNVDYYASFDNFHVGVIQANSIVDTLGLKAGKGPFNIELFGGSPDDNNAFVFYEGAMSVLQPYLASGKLVVQSRQTTMDVISTKRWSGAAAKARMQDLLYRFYATERLDAVLSPYDGMSIEILAAMRGFSYCTTKPCPVLTGQDAELPSIRSITRQQQTSTVFKDTRELAKVAASMAIDLLNSRTPEINDTRSYHNGIKTVPSRLLKPQHVDASNWKPILIDSNYYKESYIR